MMSKEQLSERIDKKNSDIQKINKRIEKWSKNCTAEDIAIAKEYGMTSYDNPQKKNLRNKYDEYMKSKGYTWRSGHDIDEVMRAYSDLRDNLYTLEKYQSQLDEVTNFEKEDKIEVLVEFLRKWRAEAYDWYIKNAERYIELKSNFDAEFTKFKNEHTILNRRYEYRLEQDFSATYYASINALTKQITINKTIDTKTLNKVLDDEVVAKYKDLVLRISSVVGEITDVSYLSIGSKNGEINGIVIGTKGRAKVETISASGPVQCFHYRVLVHKYR